MTARMTARIALLGIGTVGSALLARLDRLGSRVTVVYVSSSQQSISDPLGIDVGTAVEKVRASEIASDLGAVSGALGARDEHRLVVDATASPSVAARHAHWLLRGIHVVTASKLANGGGQIDADALNAAARVGRACYGASATVGAGLPLLATIASLRAGGDEIHRITGVLSGSLAWILDAYETAGGHRPLSDLIDEARRLGLTEPDPSVDVSGADVLRKLLILARASGARLDPEDVDVSPLLTGARFAEIAAAAGRNRRLRYVASWAPGEPATVGLVALPFGDPLAVGRGCDNRVAIWSTRYAAAPLIIQGPGAGGDVTAAALVDDLLRAAAPSRWG